MKKKKKIVIGILIFLALCVLSTFLPDSEKTEDVVVDTPVSKKPTQEIEDDNTEDDISTAETTEDFNIDWNACIEEVKTELTNEEFFSFVKDINIEVKEDERQIVFTAALGDSTDPDIALDFGDTMLRRLNASAQMQDHDIKGGSKDYYGSIYDSYSALVGIAPLSKTDTQDEWFVYDAVAISAHTKLKLQKKYR